MTFIKHSRALMGVAGKVFLSAVSEEGSSSEEETGARRFILYCRSQHGHSHSFLLIGLIRFAVNGVKSEAKNFRIGMRSVNKHHCGIGSL